MTIDRQETILLHEEIERLKAHVEALDTELKKRTRQLHDLAEGVDKCFASIQTNHEDIFARLVNVEFKIFPNLARDLAKAHRIVGFPDDRGSGRPDTKDP